MKKISIDIEKGSNKGYVVTHYKTFPSKLQQLAGVPKEVEVLAFQNSKDLAEWIDREN